MKYVILSIIILAATLGVLSLSIEPHRGAIDYRTGQVTGGLMWNLANATTGPCSRQPVYRTSGTDTPAPAELPAAPYPTCP